MFSFKRIVGFDWDEGNATKSADKHGILPIEAEQVFAHDPLLVLPDSKHSTAEPRWHALGKTHTGRLLHVTFTLRFDGTRIQVISARDMHGKERRRYEQKT